MPYDAPEKHACEKCGGTLAENNFYHSNNKEKFPDNGILPLCKRCLTMHINNWEPATFIPILQDIDVPYVEEEWMQLIEKFCTDPKKVNGMTVLGRYLSKMKLKQWKDTRWADTEAIRKERDDARKLKRSMEEYMDKGIMSSLVKDTSNPSPEELEKMQGYAELEEQFGSSLDPSINIGDELTDDDKRYLTIKWGNQYRPHEWIKLEKLYEDTMSDFDIQTSTHRDTLELICKTSLKAHQAVDINDFDGYTKLSRIYDSLMKSANFAAVQNKKTNSEFVDSVGELVSICEKENGFIPKYHITEDADIVDKTLSDFKQYVFALITQESNLGGQIEAAIKQLEKNESAEGELDDEMSSTPEERIENNSFTDEDFEEFYELMNEDKEEEDTDGTAESTTT